MDNFSINTQEYRLQKLQTYITDYLQIHQYLSNLPKKDLKKLLETYLKSYQQQKYNHLIFNLDLENKSKFIFVSSDKELFKLNSQLFSVCYMVIQKEQDYSLLSDILRLFTICIKEEYYPNPLFLNILILFKYLKSIDYDLSKVVFDTNTPLTLSTVYLPIAASTASNKYSLISSVIDDPFALFLIRSIERFVKSLPTKQKVVLGIDADFVMDHSSDDGKYMNIQQKEVKELFVSKQLDIKGINLPFVIKKDILAPKLLEAMDKKLKKDNKKLISQLWFLHRHSDTSVTIKPVYYYKDTFVELFMFRFYNKYICPLKNPKGG